MNQPLISFIVPVYKAEDYLNRCIQSILAQGIKEWELILIDDGSPDKSGEICEQFAQQDNRIHVIHKKNAGQGAARNTGVNAAIGKWLMFIDADDWLDKNMSTECTPYLSDDIDILTFCRRDVYSKFSKERKIGVPKGRLIFETKDEINALQINMLNPYTKYEYTLYNAFFRSPWAKFMRRSFWLKNQLAYVEGEGEDVPCLLKAYGCARKILHIDSCYYNYWIHSESTMRKYIENIYDKSNLAISTIHEYASTYMNVSDECCEALRHIDIGYFSLYVMQDYCHRANPQSYKERKERFHRDIQKQEFNNSFKTADLSCLPIRKRILAMLIRGENFFLINFMCRINGVYNKLMYNKK